MNKASCIRNPEDLLDGLFLKPNTDQFWHHVMKVKKKEHIYQSSELQPRIEEITKRRGFVSFTMVSDRGWTPAHVAVLANNEAGLRFLKLKGALAENIRDQDGNTPLDLARKFRPEFVSFFEEAQPSISFDICPNHSAHFSFLEHLFAAHHVELPKKSITSAAHSDDFGVEIKSLLFAQPSLGCEDFKEVYQSTGLKVDHLAKNMTFFAEKFGFKLEFSKRQYMLRDNLIRLPSGKVIMIADSENTLLAIDRCLSRSLHSGSHACFLTHHLLLKGTLGGAHEQNHKAIEEFSTSFGFAKDDEVPTLRFFMEGGNHYLAINCSGSKVLLFGEDTLFTGLNQMRRDGVFKDPYLDMGPSIASYKKELSSNSDLLMHSLEEMYAQGLITSGKGKEKGFISREEMDKIISNTDRQRNGDGLQTSQNPYLDYAKEMNHYIPLNLSESQKQNGIEIAAEYLAQKEFTKLIIAESFSLKEHQVFFIPQLAYHLDIFLRPGPRGSIFVQDYSLCVKLLREIAAHSDELGLTPLDNEILQRYLKTAEKLDGELGPLCEKVKEKLVEAGLCVIPAPGLLYDVSSDLLNPTKPDEATTFNLNFLNAITGWSSKTKSHYYLTMGAGVGDHLGSVLMRSFEEFLKRYQPDIQVGFLGNDPDNKSDFSEGMRWLNRRGSQAGPHCFAFALETASHL